MFVFIVLLYFVLFAFLGFFYFCSIFSFSTLILFVGSFDLLNCLPDNLYCVGGDVKPCSVNVRVTIHTVGIISISRYRDIDRQPRQATISYSKPCQRYRVNVRLSVGERSYVVITGINQHTLRNTSRRPRTAAASLSHWAEMQCLPQISDCSRCRH